MSLGIARGRLAEERKSWRKNHPHLELPELIRKLFVSKGFVAKPETGADGALNMLTWQCTVPGKVGTNWEGGSYPVTIQFSEDYPSRPPMCKLPAGFFHPNVYNTGAICLSILNEDWRPAISVKQILVGIQELLDDPNQASPAQQEAYMLLQKSPDAYKSRIKRQAQRYPAPPV